MVNKISSQIIDRLAQDISCSVRAEIAQNSITPREILEQLSCDRCVKVRLEIAKNPQTPLVLQGHHLLHQSIPELDVLAF